MKLLNPGPVSMTERVRAALACEDVCHREPEFKELVGRVRERIASVYEEANAGGYVPVLLGGSGTCAVETMLSLVAKDESSLVVANANSAGSQCWYSCEGRRRVGSFITGYRLPCSTTMIPLFGRALEGGSERGSPDVDGRQGGCRAGFAPECAAAGVGVRRG